MLTDSERNRLSEFENFQITLQSGESVPLLDVVQIHSAFGFDTLRHIAGRFSIEVGATVDQSVANIAEINNKLASSVLAEIAQKYNVNWEFGTRAAEQGKTEQSMMHGAIISVVLIYLTLAWIFRSYFWPLFVMLAIPFGIVGASWGHYWLDFEITIISILGLIGLSGIVVNNAIVLVDQYRLHLSDGVEPFLALTNTVCERLRAIIVTTLTTIVGLLPLMFEESTQAQFLIPMALTIIFGLSFSALIVLFFVPAVLRLHEKTSQKFRTLRLYFSSTAVQK